MRIHLPVGVPDIDRSVAFHATPFGTGPTVLKGAHARWMLDDPTACC